jgi:hypothetical protein
MPENVRVLAIEVVHLRDQYGGINQGESVELFGRYVEVVGEES